MKRINEGVLVWITGLPGAGKSTLSQTLLSKIKKKYKKMPIVHMDGDDFRNLMDNDLGYSESERIKNAYRIVRICHYLYLQGLVVICSTVSLYKEIHEWININFSNKYLIFIECDQQLLIDRNQKKLYEKIINKKIKNLIGIDQKYNKPENPDLIIKNNKSMTVFKSNIVEIIKFIKIKYDTR